MGEKSIVLFISDSFQWINYNEDQTNNQRMQQDGVQKSDLSMQSVSLNSCKQIGQWIALVSNFVVFALDNDNISFKADRQTVGVVKGNIHSPLRINIV